LGVHSIPGSLSLHFAATSLCFYFLGVLQTQVLRLPFIPFPCCHHFCVPCPCLSCSYFCHPAAFRKLHAAVCHLSLIDIDTVRVITQKFSNPRFISLSDFNSIYISHLASGQLHTLIRSYSYYSSKMLIFNSLFPRLHIKNKQITTHLFRHNYVKKLFDQGQTIEEISSIIGEREPKNTLGYVYSQISSS
jgi:hypothetical protein